MSLSTRCDNIIAQFDEIMETMKNIQATLKKEKMKKTSKIENNFFEGNLVLLIISG